MEPVFTSVACERSIIELVAASVPVLFVALKPPWFATARPPPTTASVPPLNV